MKSYKAILFDMDGVIVDSMDWHAESWQNVFRGYGIELSKHDIFKREGMSGTASIIDILEANNKKIPGETELNELLKKKLEIFESAKIAVFSYAEDILKIIKQKGMLIGLVTGSLRRSVNFVLPENIYNYFDVIVTVDDIKNGKPHPEPYLKAMEKLVCDKKEALVIENAPLGIISAKRAGADCYAIETTLPASYLEDADRIFKNHKELFNFFNAVNNISKLKN